MIMSLSQIRWLLVPAILIGLAGCSGGGGSAGNGAGATDTPTNAAPTANAGVDQRVVLGIGTVTLDGSGSNDPDGDTLQFTWSFVQRPAGSSATLSNATASVAGFMPDQAGMYRIELAVSDGQLNAVDIIDVDVAANTSPVANAGPDQQMNRGETVTIDGSASSDPEGQPLTYSWTQVANGCPDVTGGSGVLTGLRPSFVAPNEICTVAFDLRVNDGMGDSFADRVLVLVLEDKNNALFVDGRSGVDGNPGTRALPKQTIQAAVDAAASTNADVYIAAYSYGATTFTLVDRVSLYGGYDSDWQRDPTRFATLLVGGTRAVSGVGVSGLTLDGLRITSADATVPGDSSYALFLSDSSDLVITRNVLVSGRGARGNDGARGSDAPPLSPAFYGADGGAGSCDGATEGSGGPGGALFGTTGTNAGGRGGNGGQQGPNDGQRGFDGLGNPFYTPGGAGGRGDIGLGRAGARGMDGARGSDGAIGGVGTELGTYSDTGYAATNTGGTGRPGFSGAGGGGGGGGGGQGALAGDEAGSGNGGGGGGTGGVGGAGGTGGSAGGGSFGIYLASTTAVTVRFNIITVGGGGSGGDGGPGGFGSNGAQGGAGGTACTSEVGAGGNGGNGGRGGDGGQGGGGTGGPSVGIAAGNSTQFAVPLSDNTINVGAPAAGGAPNGSTGTAVSVHSF